MHLKSNRSFIASLVLAIFLVCAIVLAVGAPGTLAAGAPETPAKLGGGKASMPSYKPGEVIVVWNDGTSADEKSSVKSDVGVERCLPTGQGAAKTGRELLKLEPGVSAEAAVSELNRSPAVKTAGLNRLMQLDYTPSSPDFANQWGLDNTGQTIKGQAGTPDADTDAVEAWDIERGNSNATTVAVIDSGVDLSHPNLSNRLWTNSDEIPNNGIDDDGNGYVDDRNGYNWAGISNYRYGYYAPFGSSLDSQYIAQSFVARGTGGANDCRITGAEVVIYGIVGTPTSNVKVALRSSLTGADLTSYTLTPAEINTGGFFYKSFSSPQNLTNGSTYYLVMYTTSVDASNYYYFVVNYYDTTNINSIDAYVEGNLYMWTSGTSSWDNEPLYDMYFKTNGYYCNRDNNGHGTHCCGIVGAADSGSGPVGVAHGDATRIMALKAGDASGSLWTSDWMDALDYASANGANVVSMSFGGTGYNAAAQSVVTNAYNNGLTLFASSGNSGNSTMQYPVGYVNVIGVGATDNQDNIASFSTHNSSVDVSAPGVNYYSTMPTFPVTLNRWYAQTKDYLSGTSMACPTAAGLGALVHSRDPALTPAQVESLIETNADDKGDAGRDDYFGYGRINAFSTLGAFNPLPVITGISPASKTAGDAGFTLTVNGANFVAGSVVRWNGSDRATTYVSPTQLTAAIPASDMTTFGTANVTVFTPAPGGGTSIARTFTVYSSSSTWYLAEGSTISPFSTYISIQNPNTSTVHASLTYMTTTGTVSGGTVTLPARSQATVNPASKVGSKEFSTKVTCTEGKPIVADRTMSWTGPGASGPEAHSSVGVTAPSRTWYLPEGSSAWGFDCRLALMNPNSSAASVTLTYMIEGSGPVTRTKTVGANRRATFSMASDIGSRDASIKVTSSIPVVPERSMYRYNTREGHCSIGTTAPASDYYLAEGTSAWGFTTYVLVQNPNNAAVTVNITFMTASGPEAYPAFSMPANSRKTIRVNDISPAGGYPIDVSNTDFSTRVHGSKPIIAERSMYWDSPAGEACHDSIGLASPHATFYCPDGQSSEGRETWTLVQNPNSSTVTVEITYMTPSGSGNKVFTDTIPANSRKTYNLVDKIPGGRAAIQVRSKTSGKKIMVERAMYWSSRDAGTDTIGGYGD